MRAKLLVVPSARDDRPEAELIVLARDRNDAAVRELIRRCNQQLFRVARGILHNDAEAEDAVQAVYVAAFTGLAGFRGESKFATWLTRITINEAYGRLRRDRHVADISEYRDQNIAAHEGGAVPMLTPSPTNPETEYGRAEIRHFLEKAVDSLPEPFRLIYVMRDVQEISTREVAHALGINAITVKTRLFRARRLMRAEFKRSVATEFAGIFPFDGARCVSMAERVIMELAAIHACE